VRSPAENDAAEKRAGPSGDLYRKYVAEVAPLFRLRRSRAIQQLGRELHAPSRVGPQELAARGEPTVRTKGGRDSLGRRILSTARPPCQKLSTGRTAWHGPPQSVRPGSPHSCPLGRLPKPTWVGRTDTVEVGSYHSRFYNNYAPCLNASMRIERTWPYVRHLTGDWYRFADQPGF